MGNSASSSLPYSIGKSLGTVHDGWTLHEGHRKSDQAPVSVFIAKKTVLSKVAPTPPPPIIISTTTTAKNGVHHHHIPPPYTTPPRNNVNVNVTQLGAALHHYQYAKKLRHPHIVQVLALLDTDHPASSSTQSSSQSSSSHPTSPAASSASTSTTAIPLDSQTTTMNGGNSSSSATSLSTGSSASAGTGDLIIVTEPVVTLEAWLHSSTMPIMPPTFAQRVWALESVVRALHFLHESSGARLMHGNVQPASLFVTPAGDVKLWNFSLVSSVTTTANTKSATDKTDEAVVFPQHFRDYEAHVTPVPYRSPERIQARWKDAVAGGVHGMDAYSVGVLIPLLFGNQQQQQVPPLLQKAVQRLTTNQPNMRPRLQPLLKCPIFHTPLQALQLQLEEINIQPVEQKIRFWQHLLTLLISPDSSPPPQQISNSNRNNNSSNSVVPEAVALHKILPIVQTAIHTIADSEALRSQDLYRRELLALVMPFFWIVEKGMTPPIPKSVVDTIASLFRVNDRGIRGTLLQKIQYLVTVLDAPALNNQVFDPMCSGFSDSSSALRELTLKSTLRLVPHLTAPHLEKLCRYLIRLQGDPEASIRTNTAIFFAQLAPHFADTTRHKQLLPALIRALQDVFAPCRLSALSAVRQCQKQGFFTPPLTIATHVLPAVTPLLLDPVLEVRKDAFRVVDDLLFVLRQESERMPVAALTGNSSSSGDNAALALASASLSSSTSTPAPASGGYLSGFSSWVTSAAMPSSMTAATTGSSTTTTASTTTTNNNNNHNHASPQPQPSLLQPSMPRPANTVPLYHAHDHDETAATGWDDDVNDDDIDVDDDEYDDWLESDTRSTPAAASPSHSFPSSAPPIIMTTTASSTTMMTAATTTMTATKASSSTFMTPPNTLMDDDEFMFGSMTITKAPPLRTFSSATTTTSSNHLQTATAARKAKTTSSSSLTVKRGGGGISSSNTTAANAIKLDVHADASSGNDDWDTW